MGTGSVGFGHSQIPVSKEEAKSAADKYLKLAKIDEKGWSKAAKIGAFAIPSFAAMATIGAATGIALMVGASIITPAVGVPLLGLVGIISVVALGIIWKIVTSKTWEEYETPGRAMQNNYLPCILEQAARDNDSSQIERIAHHLTEVKMGVHEWGLTNTVEQWNVKNKRLGRLGDDKLAFINFIKELINENHIPNECITEYEFHHLTSLKTQNIFKWIQTGEYPENQMTRREVEEFQQDFERDHPFGEEKNIENKQLFLKGQLKSIFTSGVSSKRCLNPEQITNLIKIIGDKCPKVTKITLWSELSGNKEVEQALNTFMEKKYS